MAEIDTTDIDAQIDNDKRLNKTEKKARKALAKLGLKPVPNVARVTMKKQPAILFLVAEPEVFKCPGGGQETYVVYGKCNIDDGTQRGRQAAQQSSNASNFAQANAGGAAAEEEDEDMPEMTPSEPAGSSGDVSAEGLQEKDIEMVMSQASVDRKKAIAALKKNGGDIVNSIMDLTM